MAYYRLYLLHAGSGRFVGFEEIEAVDDGAAARLADDNHPGRARELWCGKRKVKTYAASE